MNINLSEDQLDFLDRVVKGEVKYWTEFYDSIKDGEDKEDIELNYQKLQMIIDTANKIKNLRNQ